MQESAGISVVVADDQPIYIAGVRYLLASLPDIVVAGEACSSVDSFTVVERVRPNVLLLSGAMPGALSLIAQLRERCPSTQTIMLAERVDATVIERALQLGVTGYLLKHVGGFDLAQAIRAAASSLLMMAPEIAAVAYATRTAGPGMDELSEREQAVLQLLVRGMANETIARELCISRSTVKFHLGNIYAKFGVRSRGAAIAVVYRQFPDLVPARVRRMPEPSRLLALAVGT
jgi:DNA-binding NarL/FixJ family response regulator